VSLDNLTAIELPELIETGRFYTSSGSKLKTLRAPRLQGVTALDLYDNLETTDFSSLTTIAGAAYLYDLKSLDGFTALTTVQGNLTLPAVASYSGLRSLASVGGNMSLYAGSCESLAGLEKLTSVGGAFTITGSTSSPLTSLSALSTLTTVGGTLAITGFPRLTTLEGLQSLSSAGGLSIRELGLASLTFPPALGSMGTLEISMMSSLAGVDIRGTGVTNLNIRYMRENLFTVTGDGNFPGNVTTEGCARVTFVGIEEVNNLYIYGNGGVSSLDLPGIKRVANVSMSIPGNLPDMEEVTGTLTFVSANMPRLKRAGTLTMSSYTAGTLSFPELTAIAGDCTIRTGYGTYSMEEILLPRLETIGGKLTIQGYSSSAAYRNTRLTNLDGLASLRSVGSVASSYNSALVDYSGLRNALPSLAAGTWMVVENGYNPTFQEMLDGKYTKE
jgi:hypothetical protein